MVSLGDLQQRFVGERSAQLKEQVAAAGGAGIDLTIRVLLSGGFVDIIQHVLNDKHDLVIKAAESWVGMNTISFGSNDLHLMRKCPCPVWIVKSGRDPRKESILAAVDTNPVNSEQDALNRQIMDLATSLAQQADSELHVVHAWNLQGDDWIAEG